MRFFGNGSDRVPPPPPAGRPSPPSDESSPADDGEQSWTADDSLVDMVAKVRRMLYEQLRAKLPANAAEQTPEALEEHLREKLESLLGDHAALLDDNDLKKVVHMVLDEVFGFGPISELLREDEVSDILINGPYQTYVEKRGQLLESPTTFDDASHLLRVVKRMVDGAGRQLDTTSPMVDARLPDGSRMNAILNPPAINGPIVSIRRFGSRPLTADDLIDNGTLTREMLDFLAACVRCRLNIVIAGGTGSGKTTLLNALSRFIRSNERVVTIEDTAELELQQPHLVKLEARPADPDGTGEITMRSLMKNTLRIRPDRIIVGECRGPEILEMLQAMNTGHEGSMTTIHANSPREALSRVELMISLGGIEIPLTALRKQMSASIDFIVQTARLLGGERKVVSISELTGMEGEVVSMHDIFEFAQTGVAKDAAVGHFTTTGIRPSCYERLVAGGAEIPVEVFWPNRFQSAGR